jgi:hypothetical protein
MAQNLHCAAPVRDTRTKRNRHPMQSATTRPRPRTRGTTPLRATACLVVLQALAMLGFQRPAEAGCGCEKPPPPQAQVRPSVTYAGAPVVLYCPALQVGQSYTVTFTSGITGASAKATTKAVSRRDLADGQPKPQLVLALPSLPLGPAAIAVRNSAGVSVLSIADSAFTVAPQPVAVPTSYGAWKYPQSRAAVGRDGVVYLALDLSGIKAPMTLDAWTAGYALRYTAADVVFRNTQGFLMQLLVDAKSGQAEPMPGMFVVPAKDAKANSDTLRYSRHEFTTYFIQHAEHEPHDLDKSDRNWHADGTPHIDHDHLILAIVGRMNDGSLPKPGATPAFTLMVSTHSLFDRAVVGTAAVSMSGSTSTDSNEPLLGLSGGDGDVFTNGTLTLTGSATIRGDATAAKFSTASGTKITGRRTTVLAPITHMQVLVPPGLVDLGAISLGKGTSQTIVGPGSFLVKSMEVASGGRLFIDNARGPVTIYVLGGVTVANGGVDVADRNPEKFALYVAGTGSVAMNAGGGTFYGVLYAPNSAVSLSGDGTFRGAVVGKQTTLGNRVRVSHADSLLGGLLGTVTGLLGGLL